MLTKKIQFQVRNSANRPPSVGPDDRRDAPHAGDVPLRLGPLRDRVDVARDGDGHRLDGPRAQALHRAERDQCRHAPREPAEDRPEQEQADAQQDHRLAADGVRQLGVDRDAHRLRQQVHREQPREAGEAAEVRDDRRHRGGQDRRVDGDQAGGDHDRDEDRPALGAEADPLCRCDGLRGASSLGRPSDAAPPDPRLARRDARVCDDRVHRPRAPDRGAGRLVGTRTGSARSRCSPASWWTPRRRRTTCRCCCSCRVDRAVRDRDRWAAAGSPRRSRSTA